MKNLLNLIFAFLFMSTGLFSQSINKLDEKNGFKDFKLGDNLTKWESQLNHISSSDGGSQVYVYKGSCCKNIFNYPIIEILLEFNSNKLVGIHLTTEKFQKGYEECGVYTIWRNDDWKSIESSFSYLFGEPTSIEFPKNTGDVFCRWIGNKVLLLSHYEYLGVLKGDRQKISIVDVSFLTSGIENGF